MRLTRHFTKNEIKSFEKYNGNPDNFTINDYCNSNNDDLYATRKICNKLGQLEDVEEELGIDLITSFKAFRKGIWTIVAVVNSKGEREDRIIFHEAPYKTLAENIGYFKRLFEKQYVENYGKTWALTKEELL